MKVDHLTDHDPVKAIQWIGERHDAGPAAAGGYSVADALDDRGFLVGLLRAFAEDRRPITETLEDTGLMTICGVCRGRWLTSEGETHNRPCLYEMAKAMMK